MRLVFLIFLLIRCLNAQNAAIEGTTLNKGTGNPLSGVHVSIFSVSGEGAESKSYGAISDRQGHFSIPVIPAGTYFYEAEYAGFVCVRNARGSAPISTLLLKAAEHITDLKVELVPQAVISGRVLDEFGDSVSNVRTQIENSQDGGYSSFPRSGHPVTDSRGEFLWIVGPGKYRIKVSAMQFTSGPPEIRDGVPLTDFGTAYYPGVPDAERASTVEVSPGDTVKGLEIRLSRARGMSVSGVVSGMPPGAPFVYVLLRYGPDPKALSGIKQTTATSGGKYQFSGLTPGFVALTANMYSQDAPLSSALVERKLSGDMTVDLALSPGVELSGKVEIPTELQAKGRKLRLEVVKASNAPEQGEIESDGSFHLKHVGVGSYRVVLSPLPENAYVKSTQLDGPAAGSDQIEITGSGAAHLKIAVGADGGQITGHVLDREGAVITGSNGMVLLLKSKDAEPDPTRNVARFTPEGQYAFKGLRPGKYWIGAIDFVRSGTSGSLVSMLKTVSENGEEVDVKPAGRLEHNLRVIGKEVSHAKP